MNDPNSTRHRRELALPASAYGARVTAYATMDTKGFIYFIGAETTEKRLPTIKIGWATYPYGRMKGMQSGNPHTLILLATAEGTKEDERRIHWHFAHVCPREDRTEWFRPSDEMVELLIQLGADIIPAGSSPKGLQRRVARRWAWLLERPSFDECQMEAGREALSVL